MNETHLICENPKTYKLTPGQQYEILKKEKGYVFVENDAGKVARYDESLFTSPTVLRTEQDCIDSITIINENSINFVNLNNQTQTINSQLATESTNSFSCGVLRLLGLNNTIQVIENTVDTSQEDLILLKRKLLKALITAKVNSINSKGMWMCSTNQNTEFEDYFLELNEITNHNSGWFRNPNSGNQINVWYAIYNQ